MKEKRGTRDKYVYLVDKKFNSDKIQGEALMKT